MASSYDARFRLQIADGFLGEARADVGLRRWRSCGDNSQLATENAAKAVLGLVGPVSKTHETAKQLRLALQHTAFPSTVAPAISRLAVIANELGWQVHIESDYGDEAGRRTPWQLFDEAKARRLFALAEEAVAISRHVIETVLGP